MALEGQEGKLKCSERCKPLGFSSPQEEVAT